MRWNSDMRRATNIAGCTNLSAHPMHECELPRTTVSSDNRVRSKLRRLALPDINWGPKLYRRKLPDDIRCGELRGRQLPDDRRSKLRACGVPDIRKLVDLPSRELPTTNDAESGHLRPESLHDGLRQWTELWWSAELSTDGGSVAKLRRHANVRGLAMHSDDAG